VNLGIFLANALSLPAGGKKNVGSCICQHMRFIQCPEVRPDRSSVIITSALDHSRGMLFALTRPKKGQSGETHLIAVAGSAAIQSRRDKNGVVGRSSQLWELDNKKAGPDYAAAGFEFGSA
jgi:hypothetical protein